MAHGPLAIDAGDDALRNERLLDAPGRSGHYTAADSGNFVGQFQRHADFGIGSQERESGEFVDHLQPGIGLLAARAA